MKKLMLLAVASLLVLSACEGKKDEQVQVQTQPAPAVEQPAAKPAPAEERPAMQSIDWDKALEMNKNGAIFVDVRNPPELNEGYAPEAKNIPLGELKNRLAELPKDKDLLIYCRSGRRSEAATNYLLGQGYTRVYNVLGGYLAFPQK
ncbi:Rhodanese-related sulfurtransferase [Fibrobacter sp. UWB15]|jgi:rhodanese-related sulfurtransferase|uniref:rhodanese-like domain-containing protein n=1 Tax=unclassified Fibrobacter TaxID=2634177 RepID=UPI0009158ABE|nr:MULTISPECIES: rhodanese-like domain-containing protein [unclassified Fibrobacter]PWJ67640.1 rhodanese-related sulfurtransferase [Fibrobacter sp. UWB6]SHF73532.1 Rhodanese-related sulfurtransferase [Fibrobacter sp. UWB8]SMG13373.1 Rhodanese-related sulfurtransferase [Fibrobacter sp. UWB15]